MRFKGINDYWLGVGLTIIICVVSLWMAVTNKLVLYIHPRYIWFTVIMCALGLVLAAIGAIADRHAPKLLGRVRWYSAAAMVLLVLFGLTILLLPPASLTSSTASQRGVNTAPISSAPQSLPVTTGLSPAAFERFSIKEWSSLLAQVQDPAFFDGKAANVSGFVSATDDTNPNIFYVSRFVVTCCAVDAQPIGVPVYMPDWQKTFQLDQWVQAKGVFRPMADKGGPAVLLKPDSVEKIAEPGDPYAR
jgi:uncharacterized repeat protein (TIGR03943 family)